MTWSKPPRGQPWPDEVTARALALYRQTGGDLAETWRQLDAQCDPKGPSKSTLRRWLDQAEDDGEDVPEARRRDQVEAAVEARRAQLLEERADLSELLVRKLAQPAVHLLANRLEEAQEDERLVVETRARMLEALAFERQVGEDMGPDARKDAAKATKAARQDLELAERRRIPVRELVGVITRAVSDHLSLEGEEREEAATGDLVVELMVPRPDPEEQDEAAVDVTAAAE